jgi:hypothetical protein
VARPSTRPTRAMAANRDHEWSGRVEQRCRFCAGFAVGPKPTKVDRSRHLPRCRTWHLPDGGCLGDLDELHWLEPSPAVPAWRISKLRPTLRQVRTYDVKPSASLLVPVLAALVVSACAGATTQFGDSPGTALGVKPPRPPRWHVSFPPKPLRLPTRTTYLYVPASASVVAMDDAGDVNRDGLRDLYLIFDDPVDINGRRVRAAIVYGRPRFRTQTIAAAARAGRARLFTRPNPRLPVHTYRAPNNAGDVNGDGRRDQDALALDWSEAHYVCGEGTCFTQYVAARFTAVSGRGGLLFDYGGPWHKLLVGRGPYSGLKGYGWLGDWNRDGRADLFEADPTGVFVYALTSQGLRRAALRIATPVGTLPYLPIALRFSSVKKADLVGLAANRLNGRAVVIVSSPG